MSETKGNTISRDSVLILCASFFYVCCTMMVNPVIAGYAESLGSGGAMMGLIGGLMTGIALVCRPIAGNLADTMDKFRISLVGAGLIFVACLGYCAAPSVGAVVVARMVNGVGYACCSVGLSTWLSLLLPKNKLGAGIGLYGTVQAVAIAIAPSIGIRIKHTLGYRTAFFVAAAFALMTAIVVCMVKNHAAPSPAGAGEARKRLRVLDPHILPIAITVALFTIPYSATQSFLLSYLAATGRAIQPDIFFSTYAIFLVVLRVGLRNQFDRWPFLRFLRLSICSSILAMVSLFLMKNYVHMACAALFMAGGYGLMCSVAQSTAMLVVDQETRGLANGTYYIGLDLGLALGPILGGLLYQYLDITWFYPALSVCCVLCVGAYFWCKRTYLPQGIRQSIQ